MFLSEFKLYTIKYTIQYTGKKATFAPILCQFG